LDEKLIVNSAGKKPIQTLNPNAIKVMKEIGIDISENVSTNVELFLRNDWTYVLTLDENIQENCPIFFGKVRHLIFMGFDDPDSITGTEEEILQGFRTIRNKIKEDITKFYFKNLQ
jgi:arsenate reductase